MEGLRKGWMCVCVCTPNCSPVIFFAMKMSCCSPLLQPKARLRVLSACAEMSRDLSILSLRHFLQYVLPYRRE